MNKKIVISVAAMFVLTMALDILVHGVLLFDSYAQLPSLYRGEQGQQTYFLHMLLAHVFIAVGFVWVYLQGKEDKPWLKQGLLFGLAMIVLTVFPTYLIYYAVQPLPDTLVAQQIIYDSISKLATALVLAWINR